MSAPWVLLRGLAREAAHWAEFADLLSQASEGAPVYALDLPGAGIRSREHCPTIVAAIGDKVRADFQEQAPGSRPWLVGLSLGGMVAMDWLSRRRGECAGAVIINSSAAGASLAWERLIPSAGVTLARIAATSNPRAREAAILGLTSTRADWPPAELDARAEIARLRPVSARNAAAQIAAAGRFRLPPRPSAPVLVLASLGDRVVAPRCSERIASLWKAPCHRHPSAGHDLPLDDPRWVVDQIREWVSQLTAPPSAPK